MIEKLVANMLPVIMQRIGVIPVDQKRGFAKFIGDLCALYIRGDKLTFQIWLSEAGLSDELKSSLMAALWTDDNPAK